MVCYLSLLDGHASAVEYLRGGFTGSEATKRSTATGNEYRPTRGLTSPDPVEV